MRPIEAYFIFLQDIQFILVFVFHFSSSQICRNLWSFQPLEENHVKVFSIDALVLLNKRLSLLHNTSKTITV